MMALCACGNRSGKTTNQNEVSFDSIVIDSAYLLTSNPNSPKCDVSISIQHAKGNKADVINNNLMRSGILAPDYVSLPNHKNDFKTTVNAFVNKYISDYRRDYGDLYKQDKENSASYNCSYKISTQVRDGADNVIVYIASIYVYTGGAHGIQQTLAKNINVNTGQIIRLSDIFVPGYEQTLKDIIVEKMAKKFKTDNLDGLEKLSIFADNNVYIPDNFILDDDDITFIYCEDEIAPHAVGEIKIDIDKDDIGNILKK